MSEEPRHLARSGSANEAPQVYGLLLMGLLGLNLADAMLTVEALSLGASEANPLMAGLFAYSLWAALLVKLGVVGSGAYVLWVLREEPLARWGAVLVISVYWLVIFFHMAHLALLP